MDKCAPLGNNDAKAALKDSENNPISPDHPLAISDFDSSHRGSINSIFGDRIIGQRIPTIAAQFQYGLRSDDAVVDIVGSGTTTIADAMLELNTGTDSDGHVASESDQEIIQRQ